MPYGSTGGTEGANEWVRALCLKCFLYFKHLTLSFQIEKKEVKLEDLKKTKLDVDEKKNILREWDS